MPSYVSYFWRKCPWLDRPWFLSHGICSTILNVDNWTFFWSHGPIASYVKLQVAHASGMPGTFTPPLRVSDPDMHHGTCVTHVPWCMPGSLTSGFLWSWWRGKYSRHSRRMRNPQFYVSGKRPMCTQLRFCVQGATALIAQCRHQIYCILKR